jgi:hypothetical protein
VQVQSMLRANRPVSIRDYSRVKVFEDAAVYPIVYVVQTTDGAANDILILSKMIEANLREPIEASKRTVKLKVLDVLPKGYWWPILSDSITIIAKAFDLSQFLGLCTEVAGAATVSEAYEITDLLLGANEVSKERSYLKFINTGTIDRYESLWEIYSAQYGKSSYQRPVVSESVLKKQMPNRYTQAKSPKLILAGMVKRLEACIDIGGEYLAGKSTVVVIDKLRNLFLLLSLLNSRLIAHLYQELFGALALQGGYLRVGPPQVEKLPIRRISFTTSKAERKHLTNEGKQLYQEYLQSKDWSSVLIFIKERLPQKPDGPPDIEHEKSDVVYDLLVFLAEEMTRLNKEKQSKIKGFLTWLEKEILKGSVEDQKNKTKIKEFHNNAFEDLLNVLKKNKVVQDPCPSNIRDTLVSEFSAAMNTLIPLKARIKVTDDLIDKIVYRLYGLTETEIALVEGQLSHGEPT